MPVHEIAFLDCLQLLFLGMHEDHIGVAPLADLDGRARSDGNNIDLDAGLFLEERQDMIEQARVLRARGRRATDTGFGKSDRTDQQECQSDQKAGYQKPYSSIQR